MNSNLRSDHWEHKHICGTLQTHHHKLRLLGPHFQHTKLFDHFRWSILDCQYQYQKSLGYFHLNLKKNQIKSIIEILFSSSQLSKFIYSEKATKFCEIFPLLLTVCTVSKVRGRSRKILRPSQNI